MTVEHDGSESEDRTSWEARESGPVPLPPSRRRERISEVDAQKSDRPPNESPLDALVSASARLARTITPGMDEEDVLGVFLSELANILSGSKIVVRLFGIGGQGLDLVRSTHSLDPSRAEQLRITAEALYAFGFDESVAFARAIPLVPEYACEFAGTSHGFDLIIPDGGEAIGIVGVEYGPDEGRLGIERHVARLAVSHLGLALGRARLGTEATYLSGYLARLLEHSNVPIVVLDPNRRIRVISQALLELTGHPRADIVGRDLMEFVPVEERARLVPAIVAALRGTPMSDFELTLPRHDGVSAQLSINLVSVRSPSGEVEGVIAIARDMTEVRQLEEQVMQAEKLATLGQLAAGIVHELNNPLTSISVYSEYLRDKAQTAESDPGDVQKLDRIVRASQRILRFTRDLVTYARPSAEAPRTLRIQEVLEQSVVFCEHTLKEAGAEVELTMDDELPEVRGVPSQLHQVFINLLTNASHAVPVGAGQIGIRVHRAEAGVRVEIRDNGAGIPLANLDQVFEPFFSTKGEGKGTGLGLSIVRNILQQHDGNISVSSQPGSGTMFVVTLPE